MTTQILSKTNKIPKGWTEKRLGEVGILFKGKGISKSEILSEGICAIRYGEIYTKHHFKVEKINTYISKESAVNSQLIKKNDLIFAGSGETFEDIGKSVVYLGNQECYVGGDTIIFSPKNHNGLFLSYNLNTGKSRQTLNTLGQGQSVIHLYKSSLENLIVVLPPLPEQEAIVAVLETWDKAITALQTKISAKSTIKKGLMQSLLTGQKRLPGFDDVWMDKKIKDLCEILSGGTPDSTNLNYWNGEIPWITPTEITKLKGKFIFSTDRTITKEGLKSSSSKLIPVNSLILCSRATIGYCGINTKPICTNQGFKNLIPNNKTNILFLYYLITTMRNKLLDISSGSTFLEFTKTGLEKLEVLLPSLPEQKAIAEVLTTCDDEIEALRTQLVLLQSQKKYLLGGLVTGAIRLPEFVE